MQNKYLEAGKIVSTQGLSGEVRVQPLCDDAEFLCEFETLYLDKGAKTIAVLSARVQKNVAVLRLEGVDTVDKAAAMRGTMLYMDRDDVELGEDTYFIADLIGLAVYDADTGAHYGVIADVTQTGANDVYHIKSESGKVYLIPAIAKVVIRTDIAGGRMDIRPLKGLFDDED